MRGSTESQRISALVPKSTNWSAGVGLRIAGYAACAARREARGGGKGTAGEGGTDEGTAGQARMEKATAWREHYNSESLDFIY